MAFSLSFRLKRLAVVLGVVAVAALASVGVLNMMRGTPVRVVLAEGQQAPPAVTDSLFDRTFALYTGTHMSGGNRVTQLLNGDGTYPQLWADLRSAGASISVQMYFSMPGAVADTLAAVLVERARAGLRVRLLLDAFGSQQLERKWVEDLQAAGVEVAVFRKLKWYRFRTAAQRSHARVVVIDGRVGYTGGFGLADYWLGDGRTPDEWRESNVRVEGPVVIALQAAFASAWAEATGTLLVGPAVFPDTGFRSAGPVRAGLLFTRPTVGSTPAERFLALSVTASRRTLYITNSYFVPDDDLRRMLIAAAQRGVDVRILTVSNKTDIKSAWYAGRFHYAELLAGGVRIFEYQPTMIHAKTLVVDGVWGSIGSMNFDNRSVAFNDETNLVFVDSTEGARLAAIFLDDLTRAREIIVAEWSKRGLRGRLMERGAVMLQRVL
jgi:cardiolipin synthase